MDLPTMCLACPVQLTPEPGGFAVNVAFPDVPEALTFGDDEADASGAAEDGLVAALPDCLGLGGPIPPPGPAGGRPLVRLPTSVVAKLLLYTAMRDAGLDAESLARRLAMETGEVDKLLDPGHRSHLDPIERALAALGLEVSAGEAA
jgi:antitoxin HicB